MHLLQPCAFKRCIRYFLQIRRQQAIGYQKPSRHTVYRNGSFYMLISASESLIEVCKDILDAFGTD